MVLRYPPNIETLDLALLVHYYRNRGEPARAKAGEYFTCSASMELVKDARRWFGVYYSLDSWEKMLTPHCEGYPVTQAEMNILGLAHSPHENSTTKDHILSFTGLGKQLGQLIIKDIIQFGFLIEDDIGLTISRKGERVLHGFCQRVYGKNFSPEFLWVNRV